MEIQKICKCAQFLSIIKSFLFLIGLLVTINLYSQIRLNPRERLEKLQRNTLTKDSIERLIQNDLQYIHLAKHDTIADLGTYDGFYPALYSIFSDSIVFYLNDISDKGFTYLDSILILCTKIKKNKISNEFKLIIGNDTCTNLPYNFFRKVILRDALHHFKYIDKMLVDIRRIMKPHAKLILFEPLKVNNTENMEMCKGAMTKEELFILLNNFGFKLNQEFIKKNNRSWFEFELIEKE